MVYVSILQSLTDKGYYIGITTNLEDRLKIHNAGKVRSTKKRKPFELVCYEEFINYIEARKREVEIKSYKGGNSFRKLINF